MMINKLFCAVCALTTVGFAGEPSLQPSEPLPELLQGLIQKDFPADWEISLYEKGGRRWRSGDELKWIGMPIGGIYAGQLHLGGDGRLWHWDIFNEHVTTYGKEYKDPTDPYGPRKRWLSQTPPTSVNQGFGLKWKSGSEKGVNLLDKRGFEDIQFLGEYPMGFVKYRDSTVPLDIDLTAFSPFVPLNADDSAYPATVMEYTVKNTSGNPVEVEIGGWMGNHVLIDTGAPKGIMFRENTISSEAGLTTLLCAVEPVVEDSSSRTDIVISKLKGKGYEGWTVFGNAFGDGPGIKWKVQSKIYGDLNCPVDKLIHSFYSTLGMNDKERKNATGRLLGDAFKAQRDYISFWISGGDRAGKTCVNLLVDGQVVQSETGRRDSMMRLAFFDVKSYTGKNVQLEVVVDHPGNDYNWIAAANFIQTDNRAAMIQNNSRDYGTMALSLLGDHPVNAYAGLSGTMLSDSWEKGIGKSTTTANAAVDSDLTGGLTTTATLKPGESKTFIWLVSWHFKNQLEWEDNVGRHYASRFTDAKVVALALAGDYGRLKGQTELWHQTWNDSSLPQWFLDRSFMNIGVLASSTARRFEDGQFWAWEGVGSCAGTCTHVWQYAQQMARIFPELERNCRERTDYGFGMLDDGSIRIRGSFGDPAVDGQAGVILRTYREHQMSADDQFLKPLWPKVKKAMDYLMAMDGGEGLLEGAQHNTLDSDWYGQVSWLSSLYIAALRASEEMAIEMGDAAYAEKCGKRWRMGSESMVKNLYNGKYFINILDPDHPDSINSGTGSLTDQVMGQGWAFQVGLGRILPEAETRSALRHLFDYNFTTDVGPFREKYPNARDFAIAGEPGLIGCTFPDPEWVIEDSAGTEGKPIFVGYFNECQSGYEYEAGAHMIAEDMLSEGLSIVKAIDARYHPSLRNPFNEIECGNYYARSMAVYGAYLNICGFEYHGPKGYMAFAPKLKADAFKSAFTSAEGWGSIEQSRKGKKQTNSISVKYGTLELQTIGLNVVNGKNVKKVTVKLAGKKLPISFGQTGTRVSVELGNRVTVPAGQSITIELR